MKNLTPDQIAEKARKATWTYLLALSPQEEVTHPKKCACFFCLFSTDID